MLSADKSSATGPDGFTCGASVEVADTRDDAGSGPSNPGASSVCGSNGVNVKDGRGCHWTS